MSGKIHYEVPTDTDAKGNYMYSYDYIPAAPTTRRGGSETRSVNTALAPRIIAY